LSIDSTGFSGERSVKKEARSIATRRNAPNGDAAARKNEPRDAPVFHSRTAMMHDALRCALSWSVLRRGFTGTPSKNND